MKNIKQKILSTVLNVLTLVAIGASSFFLGAYLEIQRYEQEIQTIQSGNLTFVDNLGKQMAEVKDKYDTLLTDTGEWAKQAEKSIQSLQDKIAFLNEDLDVQSAKNLELKDQLALKDITISQLLEEIANKDTELLAEKDVTENRVVKNISLMETGEALGHGSYADLTTISMLYDVCVKKGKVKSYINHAMFGRAMESVGYFENFRVTISSDGQQAYLAADLVLFDTNQDPKVERFLEMVEETPESIAISVSIICDYAIIGGDRYIRPIEIQSGDIVDFPALNKNGIHPRE